MRALLSMIFVMWLMPQCAGATVLVASTTSTANSGLLSYLQPMIEADLGFTIRFIVTGTGKALRLGENKDVDLVWVHDDAGEIAFMQAGHGLHRQKIMYNRFVLVGGQNNPAAIQPDQDIVVALAAIARQQSVFVSRGDDSGTHRREQALWQQLDPLHPVLQDQRLPWYFSVGSGMGATLNITAAMNAYTLSDEATWLRFANKQQLTVLLADDPKLYNPYSVLVVADTGRPEATQQARMISDWLVSPRGQKAIDAYRIDGQQAFFAFRWIDTLEKTRYFGAH